MVVTVCYALSLTVTMNEAKVHIDNKNIDDIVLKIDCDSIFGGQRTYEQTTKASFKIFQSKTIVFRTSCRSSQNIY